MILGVAYSGLAGVMYSGGPDAGLTNAPGEGNCTGCHSGSLNPVPANLANFTLTGNFTGGGYIPDSTYTLTLSYSQSGINKYGFEITALRTSNNAPAGDFTAGTGSQKKTASISGQTRQYILQNSSGNTGTGGRSWTFTWEAPGSNMDTITFYAVVNAADGTGQTNDDEIYAKVFKIAPSSLLPTAIIQTSKSTVCAGDTVTFYGSGTNSPVSYRWKFASGSPQTVTTQSVVRTYSTAGTFSDTLWVTNNKGESRPVRYQMQVFAKPAASVSAVQPNDTMCVGDSIILSANTGAGLRYLWNTGNAADTLSTVKIKQSGSYMVTVTNASGCSRESTPVNLVFLPKPVSSLNSNTGADTVCVGTSIIIRADSGYRNYTFFNGANQLQTGSLHTLTISQPGSYNITVVSNNGICQASSVDVEHKVILPLLPAPVVQCGDLSTDEVNFHWNRINGAIGYEVSIDNGTFTSVGTDTFLTVGSLNFNTAVLLEVRAIGSGHCPIGQEGNTICTSLPCSQFGFNVNASDWEICSGGSTDIMVNNLGLSSYEISFNGSAFVTDTVFTWSPSTAGEHIFTLAISDLNSPGCPPLVIKDTILVDTFLNLTNVIRDTAICRFDTLSLTASQPALSYSFYLNGVLEQQGTIATRLYSNLVANDRIRYEANTVACVSAAPEVSIDIHPSLNPQIDASGNNKDWDFGDITVGSYRRLWDFGDASASDTNAITSHTYADTGNYTVTLITVSANGCLDTASTVIHSQNVGIDNPEAWGYRFGPNPGKGYIWLTREGTEAMHIEVYDALGRIVKVQEIQTDESVIDLRHLEGGMYTMTVNYRGRSRSHLLILNK